MVDRDGLKQQVCDEVDRRADLLLDASHRIHAHPELGFEEHHAHDLLTAVLDDAGLATERSAFDVPTAFRASAGSGDGPLVAVLCEYDALPDIGHACGHNVIASAGLGAALAAAAVAHAAGGRLAVLGTPAETPPSWSIRPTPTC
jgi:metal-dependent amidase/aminoacylase/carboxypeptidase family protein